MPLIDGALNFALFPEVAASSRAKGLLGNHHLPYQLEGRVLPEFRKGRGDHHSQDAISSFLSHAPARVGSSAVHRARCEDFLFGSSLAPKDRRLGLPQLQLDREAVDFLLPTPKMSMMAGVSAFFTNCARVAKTTGQTLDPFGEGSEGEETGWCKFVPRGLKIVLTADALSALIVALSWDDPCEFPLKGWLLGGILLGFPVSYLVHKLAGTRPAFKYFRLQVRKLRGGGSPADFALEGLVVYDQFSLPIPRNETTESKNGDSWSVAILRDDPQLLTGYHLITHSSNSKYDPVSWTLEGSADSLRWRILEEVDDCQDVPQARNSATRVFEDLDHLEDSASIFRCAFLAEVAANGLAFAWLVAGTAWVSAGTDTCVDSAPLLWCFSYLLVVIVWSMLGTMTIGLIVSAVAMVVLGARGQSP